MTTRTLNGIDWIGCEHVDGDSAAEHVFEIGDHTCLLVCAPCYRKITGDVALDIVSEAVMGTIRKRGIAGLVSRGSREP